MNILYIGPYKSNNILHNASKDIIYDINHNPDINDFTIRPIYINNNNITNKDLLINNLSSKKTKHYYDTIIQHAPISMINNTDGLCNKSIVIPLFKKILGSNEYYETIQFADEIYTDSIDFTLFLNSQLKINAKTFSYTKIYDDSKDVSFSVYDNTIKFYSIFQEYEEDLFYKTIHAFYQSFGNNDYISLILVFNTSNKNTISAITEKFNSIKQFLGLKSNIFNVQIIIKDLTFEDIVGIHKKCNIYIDIESTNEYSKINRYLANQNNKKIITEENLVSDVEIWDGHRNEYITKISSNALANYMIKIISENSNNQSFIDYPNISSLICQ